MPDPPHSSRSVPVFPDPTLTLHSPWSPDFSLCPESPPYSEMQRCPGVGANMPVGPRVAVGPKDRTAGGLGALESLCGSFCLHPWDGG